VAVTFLSSADVGAPFLGPDADISPLSRASREKLVRSLSAPIPSLRLVIQLSPSFGILIQELSPFSRMSFSESPLSFPPRNRV